MKILVFSDTHKKIDKCIDIINKTGGVDCIIHAGDHIDDADDIASIFENIAVYSVSGNNDFYINTPSSRLITIADKKIFFAHGHDFHVRSGTDEIVSHAKKLGADIVIYGHTHQCHDAIERGVHVLNPGSIGFYPFTYAVLVIEDGSIKTRIEKYETNK